MEERQDAEAAVQPAPEPKESALRIFLERRRVAFIAVVLLVEVAMFMAAIVMPVDPNLRQQLVVQGQSTLPSANTSAGALVGLILANNLRVALLEMIPIVGFALLPTSILVSGIIIQGFAASNSVPPALVAFSYLLLPFTFFELLAYAIALVSGTMVIAAWRGKRLRREARVFALEIVIVAIVLVIAATMETVSIINPLVGVLLWIPVAGLVVAVVLRTVKAK